MRPLNAITQNAVGSSAWVPLDIYTNNGQLTLDLGISGTATAQVDFTDDNPFTTATPAVAGQMVASTSSSSVTKYSGPIPFAVRLTTTAYTNGNVVLKVVQQGIGGV